MNQKEIHDEIPDGYYVFMGDSRTVIDGKILRSVFKLINLGFSREELKDFMRDFRVGLTFREYDFWKKITRLPIHDSELELEKEHFNV